MENVNTKENDESFNIIIQHKDVSASNLKEVFDSYGLDRLESKVPVVPDSAACKLQSVDSEQLKYSMMSLTSQAAQDAVKGHVPRTRNKVLKLVSVGDQTILATGETRERSPVDEDELNAELEEYMREKAKRKAEETKNQVLPVASTSNTGVLNKTSIKDSKDIDEDDLDDDLDNYMKEAKRKKEQMSKLVEHSETSRAVEQMELDFDDERFDDNFSDGF